MTDASQNRPTDNALILIAEDDADIAQILTAYLDREGFRTVTAGDGEVALMHHQTLRPDLVLLDVQMPKLDGVAVLGEIRRRGGTPVIMATARAEDLDKLLALSLGADDYVIKPFNPLEVVARVKAVLRRVRGENAGDRTIRWGPIEIDPEAYIARVTGGDAPATLDLTLTEYRLLAHLARSPSRVFTRAALLDACLPEGDALERTVDSHMSKLRRKLEAAGAVGLCAGVRGIGYRLEAA
ncbi:MULTISPECIES: response regulator [unclassified Sphingomonas]|uniref:response regulator n=1 Tax=unclassified Sphingomonas TaxID=196159 RepID=UPI000BC3BE2D|nr:MAG: DNA-binding response regulator [Sphingomonas sp. 12-62-6]OYX39349.1 MAG: DNA-binding response regulator [Sphingomonas sp. 32-62-10]OYY64973.1 MAG: DNA-binding response regulator [Sphingomonas sp. 28-62-11]